jgi:hypothetical protein
MRVKVCTLNDVNIILTLLLDFVYRNPAEELDNRYFWRSLEDREERKAFFDFTGSRFTVLDLLPGWDSARRSPPDAMHLIYLNVVNWLVKQVLVAPNMFHKRQGAAEKPVDKWNSGLGILIYPHGIGRLPANVSMIVLSHCRADIQSICGSLVKQPGVSRLSS